MPGSTPGPPRVEKSPASRRSGTETPARETRGRSSWPWRACDAEREGCEEHIVGQERAFQLRVFQRGIASFGQLVLGFPALGDVDRQAPKQPLPGPVDFDNGTNMETAAGGNPN